MNYYRPSEIADNDGKHTGKWRYTVTNDKRTWATGYCADLMCQHDTPDEAREHYRQYELDNYTKEVSHPGHTEKCEVCGAWTEADIRVLSHGGMGPGWPLCDEHRTTEYAREHYEANDAISSY